MKPLESLVRESRKLSRWALRASLLSATAFALLSPDTASSDISNCSDKYEIVGNTVLFLPEVPGKAVSYDYKTRFHATKTSGRVSVTGEANKVPHVSATANCSRFHVTFIIPH